MILLIRIILISLIVYLIIRSFVRFNQEAGDEIQNNYPPDNKKVEGKKVSKEIGEYIDYEEVEKKE